MNRKSVILVAILLALLGTALPIAATWYFSWVRAVAAQQRQLSGIADLAIKRAALSFKEIGGALRVMDPLTVAPCSRAHIALMRLNTINTRSVDEMGYLENGLLKCTSWGPTTTQIHRAPAQFITPDGLEVILRVDPVVSMGHQMMELRYKNHNILTDPVRFADLIVADDIALAVATANGHVLGTLHDPDPLLVEQLLAGPSNDAFADDNKLGAVREHDGIKAVVLQDRARVASQLRQQLILLLPLGLLMAAFIVGLVIWLSRRRLSPRGELAIAVQRREFVVHYQPLIELATGHCTGAEALVRWQRPDGSMVRPDLFIPLAEESGLILPITDQVLQAVLAELGPALEKDHGLHIAVNLSPQDIRSGRFLAVIAAALAGTDVQPQQIWLEATERGFVDIASAQATLAAARAQGHKVAIDDFGTGYSSLSYLQELPLDALKIDKSFIDTIGAEAATSSVTPHIIDMAKTLQLAIVAEGIETRAQADYLLEKGVEFGQGWLYAKAMPAKQFLAFYRAQNGLSRASGPSTP